MSEEPGQARLSPLRLLVPLCWMAAVLWFSGEAFASVQTSQIIIPLLRALSPTASPETLSLIHGLIRKCAHFFEYLLLGYLWYWSLRPRWPLGKIPFLLAFFLSLGWAIFDETHQSGIPLRTGSPWDVLIDASGVLLMQAILWSRQGREQIKNQAR